MTNDERFMAMALALGRRGLGRVWPNPAVGCVIVREGRIVGRGWTQPGGRPHGETVALAEAGEAARGATAYVSLEPCAHHGATPPCAAALVAAGVARVVSAMEDPDPRVAGRGYAMLRAAGIAVTTGVREAEARRDHAGFLTRVVEGRPRLTLKLATSLDGRIATASGESRWITGAVARRAVHAERLRHDAVLVGGGTARADDPLLTVRGLGPVPQPVRIVAASGLDLAGSGRLAGSSGEAPLWLCHGPDADQDRQARWADRGAVLIEVPVHAGSYGTAGRGRAAATDRDNPAGSPATPGLDAPALLRALGTRGVTRVFCEGGGRLGASLLTAGLVDEFVAFSAGLALGAEARPALGPLPQAPLDETPRFVLVETRAIGGDVLHRWARRE